MEIIANNAFIAWEGELEDAQLTASRATIEFVATYFLPSDEFLLQLSTTLLVPLDFPEAFEVMLMKRFQQMFSTPQSPRKVMPSFFDSPKFGTCEDLVLCYETRSMPQILPSGKGKRIEAQTASKAVWPLLLQQMDAYPLLCLKPPPRSASPDAIFVGTVCVGSMQRRYTIGIAAKNYNKLTTADRGDIEDECQKFNDIFEGSNLDKSSRFNILFFCSSQYGTKTKKEFMGKKFFVAESSAWKHIDEVIVLDLSSEEKRGEFFGLKPSNPLNKVIHRVIAKDSTVYSTRWTKNQE